MSSLLGTLPSRRKQKKKNGFTTFGNKEDDAIQSDDHNAYSEKEYEKFKQNVYRESPEVRMDLIFNPVPSPHIVDYVVIGLFLCICMGIGFYYGYQTDKDNTRDNYFIGNRRLLMVPVSLSLFVTFQSAIALMGVPAEIYDYGIRGMFIGFAGIIAVLIASYSFVPLFYPLGLTSTYEYLQLRFKSKSVRTLGICMGMLQTAAYMGLTLFVPALALQTVADIPLWVSILVIGLIGTIYTAIGGIKSVVWTDAFQFVMIFIGLTAVIIKGTFNMGNNSIIQTANKGKRLQFFNFDPDPRVRHTMWGIFIGLPFAFLPNWCTQASIQRISSLRSLKDAKRGLDLLHFQERNAQRTAQTKVHNTRALLLQCPMLMVFLLCLGYSGILLYSYYNVVQCDPVQAGILSNVNQLMPFFVLDVFRALPGLSGLYISCLFSGALSTLSSGINALAANTTQDIIGDAFQKCRRISHIFAAKILVFLYGVVVIGLAYGMTYMPGNAVQISILIFGAFGSPLGGLFCLGGLVPKANWLGAIAGSVSALIFNIWIVVGTKLYGRKPVKLTSNPSVGCDGFNVTGTASTAPGYNGSTFSIMNTTILGTTTADTVHVYEESGFFLYDLSYAWYGFTGHFLTLTIGTLVSYCTGCDQGNPVETRFLFPFSRKLWRFKPEKPDITTPTEKNVIKEMLPLRYMDKEET